MAMTSAQAVAAKIRRVAQRDAEGYEISEAGDGMYLVWKNRDELLEVVARVPNAGPCAIAIPADADPALTPADLVATYGTSTNLTFLH